MKALLAKEDHNSEDMTPNHLNQKKKENINGGQNKLQNLNSYFKQEKK